MKQAGRSVEPSDFTLSRKRLTASLQAGAAVRNKANWWRAKGRLSAVQGKGYERQCGFAPLAKTKPICPAGGWWALPTLREWIRGVTTGRSRCAKQSQFQEGRRADGWHGRPCEAAEERCQTNPISTWHAVRNKANLGVPSGISGAQDGRLAPPAMTNAGGIASRNRVAPPVARGRGIVLQRALRRVYLADGREVAPPGRDLPRTIRKTPRVSGRTRQCLKKTPTCWTWPCPTP